MFVKLTFKGHGAGKFTFAWIIINILIYYVWIFGTVFTHGKEFLNMLNMSLNTGIWDIWTLLTPIGLIVLYYIVIQVILTICAWMLYKNFINNK